MAKIIIDLYRSLLLENVDADKVSNNISDLLQAIVQGMEVLNILTEKVHLSESLKDNCIDNLQIIIECSSKLLKSFNYENKFQYWTDGLKLSSTLQKDTVLKIYESTKENVSQVQSNIFKPYKILNNSIGQLDSKQLSDFYWNCEDYITFNIIEDLHIESDELNSYVWKREEIENIGNIVNCTTKTASHDDNFEVVLKEERPSNTSKSINVPVECFSGNVRAATEAECDDSDNVTTYPLSKEKISKNKKAKEEKKSLQEFLNTTLRNYHFHANYFADYATIKKLQVLSAYKVKDEVKYNIFELSNVIIIDSNLAIDKLAWHTIVNNHNYYSCILCKNNFTQLDKHLKSSEHQRKLNWTKIWIPSQSLCATFVTNSRIHCSTCLTICKKQEMAQHIKSKVHKDNENSAANKCSLILNNLREVLYLDKSRIEIIIRKLSPVLNRHCTAISEDKVLCSKCNEFISLSLEDIYDHINCQTHQKHWKIKFSGETYRRFIRRMSSNSSYCTICQITLNTMNKDYIEQHIASYSHTVFLFLALNCQLSDEPI